tara:strand:+ start:5028 stop:5234 length:207 start_codon:yes stop_codon:yes gene_type:complete
MGSLFRAVLTIAFSLSGLLLLISESLYEPFDVLKFIVIKTIGALNIYIAYQLILFQIQKENEWKSNNK